MPDHRETYRTFIGSLLSIFTMVLLLCYGGYKIADLVSYKGYRLIVANEENFYAVDEVFGFEQGFNIAAGVTSLDGKNDWIEDETIATVKIYLKSWDVYDQDKPPIEFRPMKTKPCTA